MARIEKTVFISYRRKDISWALAVYQYLTSQKYDVFFDYTSIPSGDFEEIIVSNIRARAHFVLILTPTALDRTGETGDWLRREIETAIDERRNIIPLFFDGFNFGSPSVTEKMAGKLSAIQRYNGLDIPSGYFMEAMERLRSRYLNVPLNAVIHPVSTEVRKVVKEEQVAADRALEEKKEDIQELVKPAEEGPVTPKQVQTKKATVTPAPDRVKRKKKTKADGESGARTMRHYGISVGILFVAALGILGINSLIQNFGNSETPTPTSTRTNPPSAVTIPPFTPTSEYTIGSTMISPKDNMIVVYVPAGEFTMGEGSGEHIVSLDAFWIDQTEVTNAMYEKCVDDGRCTPPSSSNSYTHDAYYGNTEFDNHPVIFVSWYDAVNYCAWADRRLPTEAEWEKAARWHPPLPLGEGGGSGEALTYPWGNDALNNNLLNHNSAVGDTTEVGSYPDGASSYGALDMAGNVSEWVNDWYDLSYYQNSPLSNPQGPASGDSRVVRGGSWGSGAILVRSVFRGQYNPTGSLNDIGFRCARSSP